MKENNMFKQTKGNEQRLNQIGLLIQAILAVLLLCFTILTIFESSFMVLTEIMVAFMMFTMAYNNYKTYKRKGLTYAYIIVGCLMILLSVMLLIK